MDADHDQILEGLRPRMRAARVAHVRRLVAGCVMVPLIAAGAAAAGGAGAPSTETADDVAEAVEGPDVEFPEIGSADAHRNEDGDDDREQVDGDEGTDDGAAEQTRVLSVAPLGTVEVSTFDGVLVLLGTDLATGWEVVTTDVHDDRIVIGVRNGESIKVITVVVGSDGEIGVRIDDVVIPTTTPPSTTSKPAPPPTTQKPKPVPAPVASTFTVEVPDRGSFVVERTGDTLAVVSVSPRAGHQHEIHQEGWKVWVKFTDGSWNWYGKALINDHGEVEKHFWDEAPPFEPIYQKVEVPGVGFVKFKLWSDGLVYVKETGTAEGIVFHDHNAGAPAAVAKVEFSGEGVRWIVEAWKDEDGTLSWSTSDMSS